MGLFTDNYRKLLIVQYADKPKAVAHINNIIGSLEDVYDLANLFEEAFDVDTAVGSQLDILGKIVGIARKVPFAVPKNYFGFSDNTSTAYPMDDKFVNVVAYPMKNKFEIPYTTGELNDNDFRFFIKAKIIKNYVKAKMIDTDDRLSLQDAIDNLFENKAYVVDNQDMSLTIYINSTFNFNMIQYIKQLDLIPRPQAVRYETVISYSEGSTFGFGVNNTGFGDKFSAPIESYFAEKITI